MMMNSRQRLLATGWRYLYTVRASLDFLTAKLLTPRISDEQIQALIEIKEKMIVMALAQEFIAAAQLDWQFHILIVDLAGNKLLWCIYVIACSCRGTMGRSYEEMKAHTPHGFPGQQCQVSP